MTKPAPLQHVTSGNPSILCFETCKSIFDNSSVGVSALVTITIAISNESLVAGWLLQSLERVDVGALVDHGHVQALAALAGDEVVVLPAVLHTPWPVQLPLGPLAVHGLQVLQGGAQVVLVQVAGLQLALLPAHVCSSVPHYAVHLG